MSKHVKTSGDYSIEVADSGRITLNTGPTVGEVLMTGNLVVNGTQTTVNSTDLQINDNIIVLNKGEAGSGVTLGEAGIRIERGSLADVQILFNESIIWNDPVSNTTKTGAFVLKDESGGNIGLECRSISTGGGNLFLINAGTGVISVSGTNNYETQVADNLLGGDDAIPNRKYVTDYVDTTIAGADFKKIRDIDTDVVVEDATTNPSQPSTVKVRVDGNNHLTIYDNRTEIHDLRIHGSTIETTVSSADLRLAAPGSGSIIIDDQLHILSTPSIDDATIDPTAPTDGLILYAKTPEAGKTGLFYVNSSTRDEIISKNRSLLLSMIF